MTKRRKQSRKKNAPKRPETTRIAPKPSEEKDKGLALWPEEFLSVRKSLMVGGAFFLLTLLTLVLVHFDLLFHLKQVFAAKLGWADYWAVAPGSVDFGIVLWAFFLLFCAGLVHPVLGLLVIAVLRPWLDGYTYPTDNLYFLWALILLFALWGVRAINQGGRLRFGALAWLLSFFILVALISGLASVQWDATYRQLLLWFSYLILFVLCINTVKTKAVFRYLLFGLVLSITIEAIFSIQHYYYLLPFLREMVKNPALLQQYFNTTELTPELARRFNVNRAFGSMLFPNALAGLLILCIPLTLAGSWRSCCAFFRTPAQQAIKGDLTARYRAIGVASITWFLVVVFIFLIVQFPMVYNHTGIMAQSSAPKMALVACLSALLPAALTALVMLRWGMRRSFFALRFLGYALASLTMIYTLWLTYSRGAMLALAVAGSVTAVCYLIPLAWLRYLPRCLRKGLALSAVLLSFVLLSYLAQGGGQSAWAQQQAPASTSNPAMVQGEIPSAEVTAEGVDLSMNDMMDARTFSLRFTYWKVALRMAAQHLWTGVGLGNFAIAYPQYQYLEAGNVREAHNCVLQFLCETGLFGVSAFLLFWAFFFLWGARCIIASKGKGKRLILAGLYGGILAFFLHALVDIHFSHPSLMMFLMIFLGAFCALQRLEEHALHSNQVSDLERKAPSKSSLFFLVPLLILVALVAGLAMRLYLLDFSLSRCAFINVANQQELEQRYAVARAVLMDARRSLALNKKRLRIPVRALQSLENDVDTIRSFGSIFVPRPGNPRSLRRLGAHETVPANAILSLSKIHHAIKVCRPKALRYIHDLEVMDSRFPYDPKTAAHISQWYVLIGISYMQDKQHQKELRYYTEKTQLWAEEALRRSPLHADMYANLSIVLWLRSRTEEEEEACRTHEQSIACLEKAVQLTPMSPGHQYALAQRLEQVATWCSGRGRDSLAARYEQESQRVQEAAAALHATRARLGVD